jgi:hypothetical protein
MAGGRRTGERLVALLVAGAVVLNFPFLSVFRGRGLLAGIPVLYVYLFLVWLLLAAGTAIILRPRRTRPRGPGGAAGPDEP